MIEIISNIQNSPVVRILILLIVTDVIFGILRSIKEKKFTSGIGINGVIRKVAMITCIVVVYLFDIIVKIDLTSFVPEVLSSLVPTIGLCEFFGFILSLFELESIIDNYKAIGLPFPTVISTKISDWLHKLTKGGQK